MTTVDSRRLRSRNGFTLIELLVVIVIIVVLACLFLPVLAKVKAKTQGIQCLSNHRQLALAWRMYAEDSNDQIPYSMAGPEKSPCVWMGGCLDFDNHNPSNWDIEQDIRKSPLWPYCGNASGIFKCPADKSTVKPDSGPHLGQTVPRVRSMSMNYWFGGQDGKLVHDWAGPGWKLYLRLSDLVDPGPMMTFVLLDVREDSISTGGFLDDMTGFPAKPELTRFREDYPASYHNLAGGFSFADGHSEIRRWMDARTMPSIKKGATIWPTPIIPSPNNKDIVWMQERSTRTIQTSGPTVVFEPTGVGPPQ